MLIGNIKQLKALNIGLVPWICNDNYEQCMNFIKDCKADWIGAHLELNGFGLKSLLKELFGVAGLKQHFFIPSTMSQIKVKSLIILPLLNILIG